MTYALSNGTLFFVKNDILSSVDYFYDTLYDLNDKHVPKFKQYPERYPPWYSKELKILLGQKSTAHSRYKFSDDTLDYNIFSELRKKCKVKSTQDYAKYLNGIENSIPLNMKSFWKFTNVKRGVNGIPNHIYSDTETADCPSKIVNTFAEYFESVYTTPNDDDLTFNDINYYDNNPSFDIGDIEITQRDVFDSIKNLDVKKGVGPDLIPAILIKSCNANITPILHTLFIKSLKEGSLPPLWKKSFVTPIFKSQDRSYVKNYRPISIMSVIPKIFESIITTKLNINLNKLIIEEQHGFRRNRSTTSNLFILRHFITEKIDRNSQLDFIYLDLAKAFDTVNHNILIQKLSNLGIHGNLLLWLKNYLTNRTLNVKYLSFLSRDIFARSGVPQGSHLGPLLFLIFINDLKLFLPHCLFLLFADDLKIYSEINNMNDCIVLQECLNSLFHWSKLNKLEFNITKCKVMHFTKIRNIINYCYSLNDSPLEIVNEFKDLGVIFDHTLKFDKHIDYIVAKANRMLGFIMRTASEFRNPQTIRTLYMTLV